MSRTLSQRVIAAVLSLVMCLSLFVSNFAYQASAAGTENSSESNLASVTETYVDAADGKSIAHEQTYAVTHETKTPQEIAGYTYLDYTESVERVYSHKDISYIYGYPDQSVRPDRPMSRCEAVAVFYRLYDGQYPTMSHRMGEKTFSDVGPKAWFYKELETLYNIGIVNGNDGGKFDPNQPISRAEFATLAARWAELEYAGEKTFSDVPRGHWAYGDINAAAAAGWVDGYPDGTFKPEQTIDRIEVMKLVNRMANRTITVEKLRELGAVNPYNDITDRHWGYPDVMEATIRHSGADWHGTNYNDGKFNVIVEKFVDNEGKEIAETIVQSGKEQATTKEIPGFLYQGYIRHVTYVYNKGSASPVVSKAASVEKTFENCEFEYTVTVGNGKDATAPWKNVVVTDNIPKGLKLVDGSVYLDEKSVEYELKDSALTVHVGDLPAGKEVKLTFKVVVQPGMAGETITNTAVAKGDNGSVKDDTHTATDKGVVVDQGKILPSVEKKASASSVNVGDRLTYTITVSNGEEATYKIADAVISDEIPAGMVLREGSVQVNGKSVIYGYDEELQLLNVPLGDVAPGTSIDVTFSVDVDKTAYGKTIKNVALLTGENIPDTSDEEDGVVVTAGETRPGLTKQANKAEANVGDVLTYTIVASNGKKATASIKNSVITDTLPEYLAYEHGSVQVNGKSVDGTQYDEKTRQLTVNIGDIAAGDSVEITFDATVTKAAYGATIKNVAVLTGDNSPETKAEEPGVIVTAGETLPSLTKKANKAEANVDERIIYTITASNGKDATAAIENSVITDKIPDGLAFEHGSVQVDGKNVDGVAYDEENRLLTVELGDIAAGKSVNVSFAVIVTKTAYGKTIENVAVLTGDNTPKTEAKDDGIVISDGDTKPNLTKKADKDQAKVGDTIVYTMVAGNAKEANVSIENGAIKDVIPEGLKFEQGSVQVDGSTAKYSYDDETRTLTVPVGELAAGSSVKVSFAVEVTDDGYGQTIKNVAILTGDNSPETKAEDPGVVVDGGKTRPTLTKKADKKTAEVGDNITYTLVAGNTETAVVAIEDGVITDVLPEGLEFRDGSVQVNGKTVSGVSYDDKTRTLTIPVGKIDIDSSVEATFMVTVTEDAYGKTIKNVAVLSSNNGPDVDAEDSGVNIGDGKAKPTIEKSSNKQEAKVGDRIEYTLIVGNEATATVDLEKPVVTDVIPTGLDFVDGSVYVDSTAAKDYNYDDTDRVLTVNLENIKPDTTVEVKFSAHVNETAFKTTIQNLATLTSDNGERKQDTDDGVLIPDGRAQLDLSKVADKRTPKVGERITYTMKVGNVAGAPVPARNVKISDSIPEGLTFAGIVQVDGFAATYSFKDGKLVIPVGDIAAGYTRTVTAVFVVNDTAYGKAITNTAVASADNAEDKPASDAGLNVPEGRPDAYSAQKTVSKSNASVGDVLTYNFRLSNTAGATAAWENATITDTIPEGLTFKANVKMNGTSTTNYAWDEASRTIVMTAPSIEPGKAVSFSFDVSVDEGMQGKYIVNTAIVKGPDGEPDIPVSDPGVNVDDGTVEPFSSKTANKDTVNVGETVMYTVKVGNRKEATADWKNVVMTDVLPAGVRLLNSVTANGAPVAFSADNGTLTAKLGNIAPGETIDVKYEVLVLKEAAGTTLRNVVTLSGGPGGGSSTDTSTSVVETPVEVPDDGLVLDRISVEKDVDKVTVKIGNDATPADRRVTYTTVVANNTKDKVWEDVVFTDVLDDGIMTFMNDTIYVDGVRLNANQFTYANDRLTIELGDLAAGKSKEVKFTVEFKHDAGRAKFENMATGTGMLDGKKFWDVDKAPIVSVVDDNVLTDKHYAIFHGQAEGTWKPDRNIFVHELAVSAYRLLTNDYQTQMQGSGNGYVSDYVSRHFGAEVSYIVGAGILKSEEFEPGPGMVRDEDYVALGDEKDPTYHIYATKDQVNRVLQALFAKNVGLAGNGFMSRHEMAKLYCQLQGRDQHPNYRDAQAAGMYVRTFPDCPNDSLVIEVSNTHAYTKDSVGNETWVINDKFHSN